MKGSHSVSSTGNKVIMYKTSTFVRSEWYKQERATCSGASNTASATLGSTSSDDLGPLVKCDFESTSSSDLYCTASRKLTNTTTKENVSPEHKSLSVNTITFSRIREESTISIMRYMILKFIIIYRLTNL